MKQPTVYSRIREIYKRFEKSLMYRTCKEMTRRKESHTYWDYDSSHKKPIETDMLRLYSMGDSIFGFHVFDQFYDESNVLRKLDHDDAEFCFSLKRDKNSDNIIYSQTYHYKQVGKLVREYMDRASEVKSVNDQINLLIDVFNLGNFHKAEFLSENQSIYNTESEVYYSEYRAIMNDVDSLEQKQSDIRAKVDAEFERTDTFQQQATLQVNIETLEKQLRTLRSKKSVVDREATKTKTDLLNGYGYDTNERAIVQRKSDRKAVLSGLDLLNNRSQFNQRSRPVVKLTSVTIKDRYDLESKDNG